MTILQRWKNTALHNKALVWASVLVAFGTLFYAGAAIFQICMMKRLARDSGIQIDKMIEKADSISKSIGTMVTDNKTALEENRKAIQDTLRENREDVTKVLAQNRTALEFSISQGKAALDASIEAFRLDHRPWVGISDIVTEGGMEEGDDFRIESLAIVIRNSGKTPAIFLGADCCFVENRFWGDPVPDYATLASERRIVGQLQTASALAPDASLRIKISGAESRTSRRIASWAGAEPFRKPIKMPTAIYRIGRIYYRDTFEGTPQHATTFCLVRWEGPAYVTCPNGGTMN